jgi:multicomponent K+:H+ antiporter subunit E
VRRWLPAPLLSATLLAVWLLLNNTLDPAHVVLGALLAVVVPWFTEPLRPERPRLRRPLVIVRLGLVVLWDIVLSNIEVARRPSSGCRSTWPIRTPSCRSPGSSP